MWLNGTRGRGEGVRIGGPGRSQTGVKGTVHSDAEADVVSYTCGVVEDESCGAPKIAGVDERRTTRIQLCDEGVTEEGPALVLWKALRVGKSVETVWLVTDVLPRLSTAIPPTLHNPPLLSHPGR